MKKIRLQIAILYINFKAGATLRKNRKKKSNLFKSYSELPILHGVD